MLDYRTIDPIATGFALTFARRQPPADDDPRPLTRVEDRVPVEAIDYIGFSELEAYLEGPLIFDDAESEDDDDMLHSGWQASKSNVDAKKGPLSSSSTTKSPAPTDNRSAHLQRSSKAGHSQHGLRASVPKSGNLQQGYSQRRLVGITSHPSATRTVPSVSHGLVPRKHPKPIHDPARGLFVLEPLEVNL